MIYCRKICLFVCWFLFVVRDKDVMDLEKAYWALKASNSKFDRDTFQQIVSPPLPAQLCEGKTDKYTYISNPTFFGNSHYYYYYYPVLTSRNVKVCERIS